MKLFDDENSSSGDDDEVSKISINKDFARRYEHNKKREDLMRLEELKKRGLAGEDADDDLSSESDSDTGELTDKKKDLEFFNALIKVKNRDPVIKEKEVKLFDENEGIRVKGEMGRKQKPVYLKDVVAKQLIEEGPEFDDEEEVGVRVKSYAEEQEEMRWGLVERAEKAMEEVEGEGDLFVVKEEKVEEEDDDVVEVEKKLDEYFGEDENLDENEVFLKKYFRNRMWVGEDEGKGEKLVDDEGLELSDDEVAIEEQEDYERGFNFRFEENAGDRVLGHSRVVEGSVRKKTNARKAQRERKEEREAEAGRERKEELKRLKNLKKKEMREKLEKIKETAGVEVCPLDVDDLDDEFDPEEHDRKMSEAFNDEYYGADDVDPEFGSDEDEDGELKKPDFDKEDELLGLGKGWDEVSGSKDGFLAAREKQLKRKAEIEAHLEKIEEQQEEEQIEEDGADEEGKRKKKKKRKMSKLAKEVLEKELEEYYKLDYEDTIGDLKTRFKYKEVGRKRYGLSTKEILALDDKELNQYVSIKKLAPYREKEWDVDRKKVLSQKEKNKVLLKGEKLDDKVSAKKKRKSEDKKEEDDEKSEGDTSKTSRNKRRKLRQAEYKLSDSRLMAYGKIPSKSKKSKKKH